MKTSCPHCGRKAEHEFLGSRFWGGWFRCRCNLSWRASWLAAVLVSRRSATSSTAKPQSKPTAKQKRHQWSTAEKAAIGKRMEAYWAKRRKATG